MTPQPGHPVRIEMQKWGGRPHWVYAATYLGHDTHGDWLGIPTGTHMSRPGAEYVNPVEQVVLVPDDGFLATFHAEGGVVDVYVDITTPATWTGDVLHAVDLDLDVVRTPDGQVWVDDEDEFEEHRVAFGYPPDVVTTATATCQRLRGEVAASVAPFDRVTAARWLDVLRLPRAD